MIFKKFKIIKINYLKLTSTKKMPKQETKQETKQEISFESDDEFETKNND